MVSETGRVVRDRTQSQQEKKTQTQGLEEKVEVGVRRKEWKYEGMWLTEE